LNQLKSKQTSEVRAAQLSVRLVPENPAGRTRTIVLMLLAVALPVLLAYEIMYLQAINVPALDDYRVILAFATDYHELSSVKTKLVEIATRQNNDYKLVFTHLVVALELELTGHLNFGFLITLGNLFLLPLAYLLWRTYQTDQGVLAERLKEFLPISILLFSLMYWETVNWAMAGLQNLSVILFSFLAIYLLIPKGRAPSRGLVLLGCLSAVLAAFSSANGFLLGPIGFWILLRRRAYADGLAWCVSFVLPVICYLYRYTPYSVSIQATHRTSYLKLFYYFLAFLGCVIPGRNSPHAGQLMPAVLGFAVLIVILLAIRARFDRSNPVAFYFTVWILATAMVVAVLRGAMAFRYSIYSLLLLIFCYAFLREYLPGRWSFINRRRFFAGAVVLPVGLCVFSDIIGYQHLAARRRMVLAGIQYYRSNPQSNSPMIDPVFRAAFPLGEDAFERDTLSKAIQQRIYALP
jgi:hypothetical protein